MGSFTTRSFVKVCGVTSTADAEVVAKAGADALGVILTTSRRQVTADLARDITALVRGRLLTVGVVDSRDAASLAVIRAGVDVDVVQVHGPLSGELLADLRSRGLLVVKALSVASAEFDAFEDEQVDAVLVDGPTPGSGEAHSFASLAERAFRRPVIAAGGLTPMSVGAVISAYGVWGVDVASGVECAPGVKDPARVTEFVDAARRSFTARDAS